MVGFELEIVSSFVLQNRISANEPKGEQESETIFELFYRMIDYLLSKFYLMKI